MKCLSFFLHLCNSCLISKENAVFDIMSEPIFVWTPKRTKKLFELRFEHDWLFKMRKQPWHEFRKILLENGFPEEMTLDHVRKKWSYTYDSYRIAKRTKNTRWKYYKMFEKHFGKSLVLDKYETWNDEWRLKLITCITEAKSLNLDVQEMWKHVEKSLRCLNLPSDCCIQDIKSLWHHLRVNFNRKHRLKWRNGERLGEWPLYEPMLNYFETYEKEQLRNANDELDGFVLTRIRKSSNNYCKKRNGNDCSTEESEFQWSKDITESFIQIRLQHDWLFRERKWAWNDLLKIMVGEYGFPNTLDGREICRKWNATFSGYQKAVATNNTSWVYYNLFKCYYGDGTFSLNPLVGWNEEWLLRLIEARTELENTFRVPKDQLRGGWREVEKKLRSQGLPLDHSLFDISEIWTHMLKTYRWKRKFADKGLLSEHWPYFDAMTRYNDVVKSFRMPLKMKLKKTSSINEDEPHFADSETIDDELDDDIKLFDLKQKLKVKPKLEKIDVTACRACNTEEGTYNLFEACDDQGLDLAHKLSLIVGIEIDKSDNLPKQICFTCLRELESAFSFRRKCEEADKEHRVNAEHGLSIKTEVKLDECGVTATGDDGDRSDYRDYETTFENECPSEADNVKVTKRPTLKRKRKMKDPKRFMKMCEICGVRTSNLRGHLDAHSSEKAYSCDVCDKRFKFRSGLQIHKAVHDPTPKKTCEICGKAFHILAQYKRHFVYHANERKHSCEACGKRFNTLDILKVHMRMHNDERPFSCQDCGKTFRTAGCVSRHRRIVHKKISKANGM